MNHLRKIGKKIRGFMDKKIEACKEFLDKRQNRATVGIMMMGLGFGMFVSAYIRVPN